MASSSFSIFTCLFLLTSSLFSLSVATSASYSVEDTCKELSNKAEQAFCLEYISAFTKEIPTNEGVADPKHFTQGFIFSATSAGYDILKNLGMSMVELAKEKIEITPELEKCINSYEAATKATLAASYSLSKNDYTKASSQMLEASNVIGCCDKPLEKSELLESHKMFVGYAKLSITFIDSCKKSSKESS